MPGRDPERIAKSLRDIAAGSMHIKMAAGKGRLISPEILVTAADEMDRMREYLLETSGLLHQLASDTNGLSPRDMRRLANDMCRMANRRDTAN